MSDCPILAEHLNGKTDAMGRMIAEGMPPPEGCDNWIYRDIPWVEGPLWNMLMGVAGIENIRLIAMSDRRNERRGQLWVSPEGAAKWKVYTERKPS